jgi:PleD family two-component response regulator
MAELRVSGTGAPATIRLTVSLGVAVLDELALGTEESALIGLADARLYRAKQGGRNRVVTEDT